MLISAIAHNSSPGYLPGKNKAPKTQEAGEAGAHRTTTDLPRTTRPCLFSLLPGRQDPANWVGRNRYIRINSGFECGFGYGFLELLSFLFLFSLPLLGICLVPP